MGHMGPMGPMTPMTIYIYTQEATLPSVGCAEGTWGMAGGISTFRSLPYDIDVSSIRVVS